MAPSKLTRGLGAIGTVLGLGVTLAAIGGGIALLVYARGAVSTEPHHGQAVDGLDGIGNFIGVVMGLGGIALVVIGGFALRGMLRGFRRP